MTRVLIIFALLIFSAAGIRAQIDVDNPADDAAFDQAPPATPAGQQRRGFSLLRDLDLSPEQIQKIRQVNLALREPKQNAMRNFETAKRRLDESIYSDTADEATIEANLRGVIEAQAELLKVRTQSELAVRKILTAEQLLKFREIRRNFAERQKMRQNRMERNINRRRPPGGKRNL